MVPGRPDFAYKARVLYAATVRPTAVNLAGGQITISGEGFRQGNQVSVNGVPATTVSLSANQIVAKAAEHGGCRCFSGCAGGCDGDGYCDRRGDGHCERIHLFERATG